jgi:phosphonoacetate hydrolase
VVQVNNRHYNLPVEPAVVVCLDGSPFDYIDAAVNAGAAPFLASLIAANHYQLVAAAMPTFTNPNNVSIVTGTPPAVHGICDNFFLERATGRAVMMDVASFLRAPTILWACAQAGARVTAVVAKDKLRQLIGAGLADVCASAEQEGVPVYSGELSLHVLRRGVDLMRTMRPDLMYLSTSDFVQHAHGPGTDLANSFYRNVDEQLAYLDEFGTRLVITADHGMSAKTGDDGQPRVVFLQELCDGWIGRGNATVILPITDPYVAHHGSLGAFAWIYARSRTARGVVRSRLADVAGIEAVYAQDDACRLFELPCDRAGDIAVLADREHVLGTRPADHDLSKLHGALRSHGGLAEQAVSMLFNRPPRSDVRPVRNYDAFSVALNGL